MIAGEVVANTISGRTVTLTAGQLVSVNSQGNPSTVTQVADPIVNFADLGPALTNLSYADALDAFAAVTGGVSTGATGSGGGGGGGGGGGSITAAPLGGGGGGIGVLPTVTFVPTTPTTFPIGSPPAPEHPHERALRCSAKRHGKAVKRLCF